MIKGRKLDHIGVACTDVEANAKWYQDVLGFEVIGKFKGSSGNNVYFLRSGTTTYELYQPKELAPEVRGKVDHVAYVSDDIEKDYAFCVEQGYKISTDGIEAIPTRWENGCRYFKIVSPTGEQIEFSQIL